jgi:hypothetical protein
LSDGRRSRQGAAASSSYAKLSNVASRPTAAAKWLDERSPPRKQPRLADRRLGNAVQRRMARQAFRSPCMKSLSCPNKHCPPSGKGDVGAIICHGFYTTRCGKRRRYQPLDFSACSQNRFLDTPIDRDGRTKLSFKSTEAIVPAAKKMRGIAKGLAQSDCYFGRPSCRNGPLDYRFMSGAMAGLKLLFVTMPSEECWVKSARVAARRERTGCG